MQDGNISIAALADFAGILLEMHIARRTRKIALQTAVGGMALSAVGMVFAAVGYLPPLAGAIAQEIIDLAAVLNALRTTLPKADLSDF